jgi:hypothetical protein
VRDCEITRVHRPVVLDSSAIFENGTRIPRPSL